MTKNPKIEFYKIHLNPTPSNEDVTFKDVFKKIYLNQNPSFDKNQINEVSDDDLKINFYKYFFNQIDTKFNNDKHKKKAFYAKSELLDGVPNTPINLSIGDSIIEGLVRGGYYDTGKNLGDIQKPEDDTEELDKNNILLDDFYFSLYTPLDKSLGILILHSYTRDQIADIFLLFIRKLFKVLEFTYNAKSQEFMPREIQDEFKERSIVQKFKFANRVLVNEMEEGVIMNEEFSISIEINSLGGKINLKNLPKWRKKLGEAILGIPSNPERELSTFNKQLGYLKSSNVRSNPTKFELNGENIKLNATIFLENYVRLKENGIPYWEDLKVFAKNTLNNRIKPEVYPEDYLNED